MCVDWYAYTTRLPPSSLKGMNSFMNEKRRSQLIESPVHTASSTPRSDEQTNTVISYPPPPRTKTINQGCHEAGTPPAAAAAPKASFSRAARTGGMLTSTVLAVAVSAIATAEKAKLVGSFTMAAVPRPCALPPCASPLAAGSCTLVVAAVIVAQ